VFQKITAPVVQSCGTNSDPQEHPNDVHQNVSESAERDRLKLGNVDFEETNFLWSPEAKHRLMMETLV
jgi:hypothetical protein